MKKWYLLILILSVMMGGCTTWIFGNKKEDHVVGLRYIEENVHSEIPVYARPEDLEPQEGDLIVEPGFFSRLNPFASEESDIQALEEATAANEQDDESLFRTWLPF